MTFAKRYVSPGRKPRVLTDEDLDTVELLASKGSSEVSIAFAIRCDPKTWNRLKVRDERVALALAKGKAAQHDYLVGCLHTMAGKGNVAAPIFLLKAKHAYSDQGDAEQTGPTIVIQMPASLSPEQWAQRRQALTLTAAAEPVPELPAPDVTTKVRRG